MKMTRYELLAIVWFIAAGVLLFDSIAFSFGVPDPSTGRGGGCYTMIELLCGVRKYNDWMRPAQLSASVIMLVLGIAISYYLRRRSKNVTRGG